MSVSSEIYDSKAGPITVWRIVNESGAYVELSSLGAGILAVGVPDKSGKIENVALSYADPADYLDDGPCMGKIPGRFANRIARGHLEIDGKTYQLNINNGPNALHGGPTGFQNRIWNSHMHSANSVLFEYVSADGEENYPGCLIAKALYEWTDDNVLRLHLTAASDAPTVVNLTNHAYWNLDGADAGCVLGHTLKLNAGKWLPTDDTLIPIGIFASVENTPMDFRKPKTLGADIKADFPALIHGKGYDNCWILKPTDSPDIVEAAILDASCSGRRLTIRTNQPGMQIYTGNWLSGCPRSRSGHSYNDYDGVALEAQGLPDAPNHPDFPSQRLNPGELYDRVIEFAFSLCSE